MKKLLFWILIIAATSATAQRKIINGTDISIIPPAGWENAMTYQGFTNDSLQASISVTTMGIPFIEVTQSMTRVNLRSQGLEMIDKRPVKLLDNQEGVLYKVIQETDKGIIQKNILLLGNFQYCYMVTTAHPGSENYELEETLRKSLMTAKVDVSRYVSADKVAKFEVPGVMPRLKFAEGMNNTLLYTADGNLRPQSEDKTAFLVANSYGAVHNPDKKAYCKERAQALIPNMELKVETLEPISLDGLEGYELIGKAVRDGKEIQLVYQVLLFKKDFYYMLLGLSNEKFSDNLAFFKKASKTFKRR